MSKDAMYQSKRYSIHWSFTVLHALELYNYILYIAYRPGSFFELT